ncbi:hypothetical protein QC762_0069040 [Podospora pseudocomata]|uniref:Uncharacterized protein n=1 Tax=Podospora pseudocomata TaxID=2093779 RepID=A0ABR0GG89_9PEZI|nr:hypothetical protein QC762_0069040 [Podospora pseudocomata]
MKQSFPFPFCPLSNKIASPSTPLSSTDSDRRHLIAAALARLFRKCAPANSKKKTIKTDAENSTRACPFESHTIPNDW